MHSCMNMYFMSVYFSVSSFFCVLVENSSRGFLSDFSSWVISRLKLRILINQRTEKISVLILIAKCLNAKFFDC